MGHSDIEDIWMSDNGMDVDGGTMDHRYRNDNLGSNWNTMLFSLTIIYKWLDSGL